MDVIKNSFKIKWLVSASACLSFVFLLSLLSEGLWFDMLVKIREAINTRDSGPLILSSAAHSALFTTYNVFIFMASAFMVHANSKLNKLPIVLKFFTITGLHFVIGFAVFNWLNLPQEYLTNVIAVLFILSIVPLSNASKQYLLRIGIIAIQVFLAVQWLNVMPLFSKYGFGIGDIPNSIKLTSLYLNSDFVLDFVGFAFLLPLLLSAIMTSFLFISFDRYLSISEENYHKEKNFQTKAMENRVHEEINALTHDLKTPLVTIRGLNSLLSMSKDASKISEYTEKIDDAVSKMSEMISSFLYDTSRQVMDVSEIIQFVRAQLPIEESDFSFEVEIDESLPKVNVNRVRIVRALINLIENAILVKTNKLSKEIALSVVRVPDGVHIKIKDNGIGIDPVLMTKIFQIGFSTNKTSGLGLSFAKKVIEDNGGNIRIDSTVNVGTTVTVYLPDAKLE